MYIYYPSCNFQKLFPETAGRIRKYLETQEDVRIAGCCHLTADLPQTGDTVVTVCMSCMRVLDEVREDVPGISLFELLLTRKDFPWPGLNGRKYLLQDCFRARGKRALQDAVRECLRRTGAEFREVLPDRDEADWDGSFLLHEPYPRNIREAPKYYRDYLPDFVTPAEREEWPALFRKNAQRYADGPVVCFCNTCVTGAREGGAEAYHLAELLFPG